MLNQILSFIELLRKAGIKISPAEVQDCFKSVEKLGFEKYVFKSTLQTTLIKDTKNIEIFNTLFDLFFIYNKEDKDKNKINNKNDCLDEKASSYDGKGLGRSGAGGPTKGLFDIITDDNKDNLFLDEYSQLSIENIGKLSIEDIDLILDKVRETQINLNWFMTLDKIEKMLKNNEIDYYTYQKWNKKLKFLQENIEQNIKKFFISKYGQIALEEIAKLENINKTDFVKINQNGVDVLKQKIKELGNKLATRKSYRYKQAHNGRINIKSVVNKAMKYGGTLLELKYERKRISRPELILICDISKSVAQFSNFMLQLIYISQNCFKNVESFVFIDHLSYVTPLFRKLELEVVLNEIKYLDEVSETGYSHFGQTLFEFYSNYINMVNDKSTIIILGDAKNNWRPSGIEYLEKMYNKCHRLYWLNPQQLSQWDKKDSIISKYSSYCSNIYECRNMNQLENVIKLIF